MSLLLAGLIVGGASGAAFVGRWLARRRGAPLEPKPADADGAGGAAASVAGVPAPEAPAVPSAAASTEGASTRAARKPAARKVEGPHAHLEGFPCQLGDVLLRLTGEEAWLAGGLVLSEEGPVAALFVAPDAGHDCAIYARPRPREAIYWMEPLDPGAVLVGGEPPNAVEQGGIRFDRVRRLPLRPKRIGVGAPDAGDAVILAEYASAGSERLVVMKCTSGASFAYRGEELEASTYEVIPSGRATLDDP
jgi:hypothetical protein